MLSGQKFKKGGEFSIAGFYFHNVTLTRELNKPVVCTVALLGVMGPINIIVGEMTNCQEANMLPLQAW